MQNYHGSYTGRGICEVLKSKTVFQLSGFFTSLVAPILSIYGCEIPAVICGFVAFASSTTASYMKNKEVNESNKKLVDAIRRKNPEWQEGINRDCIAKHFTLDSTVNRAFITISCGLMGWSARSSIEDKTEKEAFITYCCSLGLILVSHMLTARNLRSRSEYLDRENARLFSTARQDRANAIGLMRQDNDDDLDEKNENQQELDDNKNAIQRLRQNSNEEAIEHEDHTPSWNCCVS